MSCHGAENSVLRRVLSLDKSLITQSQTRPQMTLRSKGQSVFSLIPMPREEGKGPGMLCMRMH